MSRASFGKPLKGNGTLSARFTGPLEDSVFDALSVGGIPFENVSITGGTVDGVATGSNTPGPGVFTTLQTGNPSGSGFQVCFFGQTIGDSACWEPVIGRWNIQGDLLVRDISDLGNLRITSNTISSTNTNGNIALNPNGNGIINLIGPVTQNTGTGDIRFNTTTGEYVLTSGKTNSLTSQSDTLVNTKDGNINIETGTLTSLKQITSISVSGDITTNTPHNYSTGDFIKITNSGVIDGEHQVQSIVNSNTFTITPEPNMASGNTGDVYKYNNINLIPKDAVTIPRDIPLYIGDNKILGNENGLFLSSETSVSILQEVPLYLGDNQIKTLLSGDLEITSEKTIINSNQLEILDPVITVGSLTEANAKDRGIEFNWEGKTGFFGFKNDSKCFTIIPDALNTDEVFTGDKGCIDVGSIKAADINLTSGVISGDSIIIESQDVSIDSNIINIGTGQTNTDHGIQFGDNFFGLDASKDCFTFSQGSTPGNACFGNMNVNDLVVNGSVIGALSIEYITSSGGGVANPTDKNITFIKITSPGTVTGVLPDPEAPGFQKYIFISSMVSGGIYKLTTPRLLDPGSATSGTKVLTFNYPGQSVFLIWDSTESHYIPVNGGACVGPT